MCVLCTGLISHSLKGIAPTVIKFGRNMYVIIPHIDLEGQYHRSKSRSPGQKHRLKDFSLTVDIGSCHMDKGHWVKVKGHLVTQTVKCFHVNCTTYHIFTNYLGNYI